MRKPYLMILGIIFGLCHLGSHANAQSLASSYEDGKENNQKNRQTLESALKEIESEFNFSDFYKTNFIEGEVSQQISRGGLFPLKMKQEFTVDGQVTSQDGEALPGVNVVVQGTSEGSITNVNGEYTLDIPNENSTLIFSFVGYATQEVAVNGRSNINVSMAQDVSQLEEVIVVGYTEKERGELTGSVANVSGERIEETSQMNLTQALQGKFPGLVVNDRGGEPGSNDASILVRGKSTLGNNSPLIIIDGVPRESFAHLSPNDIESISVLKDASAAIYGARAANGVIQIKTKRGEVGKNQIRFTSDYGMNSFTRVPEMMNAYQFATYRNEMQERYGRAQRWTQDDFEKFESGSHPRTHPDTEWFNETFRKWAPQLHQNLSLRGGSEDIQFFISGDYLNQEGNYKSEDMYYNQYQIRSNINAKVTDYLNVGLDLSGRLEKQHSSSFGEGGNFSWTQTQQPYQVATYPNGLPGIGAANGQNPVIITSDEAGWDENNDKIFQSKLSFDLDMGWLTEGLSATGYGAFDFNINDRELFNDTWTVYHYNATTEEYEAQGGYNQGVGDYKALTESSENDNRQFYHFRFNYDRSFGDHHIDAFMAYEQQEEYSDFLSGFKRDLISDQKVELFTGSPVEREIFGTSSESGRVNYFGSLGYNYMRKYLIDFTLRRDGSFNFPADQRFGTFPGVSVAWNVSDESFMEGTQNWLDNLKLRSSWAKMGNDLIPPFQFLTQYELNSFYIFGESPRREDGFTVTNTPNPNVTWEVSRNTNVGFDAILWNDALTVSADYFYEKRRQILITRNESVPGYTALELPPENLGKVDNNGIELNLNHQGSVSNFNYHIGGNMTYNNNEIVFMDEAKDVPEYRKKEGHPMDAWVVYKTDGLFRSQEEVDNNPHLEGAKPGDIKYVDVNEDGSISGKDQIRKYTSPIPKYQFGFNAGFSYKGIQLNALFQGQAEAETMLNFAGRYGNRPSYLFTERWTEENPDARLPRASERNDIYNAKWSDFWLQDASFIRLNNLSIAYNFPPNILSNIGLNDLRVYVRGSNLLTFDKIKRFDPEINNSTANYYPQTTNITLGLNVGL